MTSTRVRQAPACPVSPASPLQVRPRLVRTLATGLTLALLAAGCGGLQTVEPSKELDIRKVVLYQNGVGYFERGGEVKGDELELRVRPDQINDVLKSLSILDFSGGQTSSVSLPVERSGDRLALELPKQVRRAGGIVGLLAVLRGVRVSVDDGESTLQGRVVGVEGAGKSRVLTMMVRGDKLVTVPVRKIEELKIHDRALAVGLKRSLDISRSEGRWKPVTLTVRLAGGKPHKLLISYIHEVPIWRPAYRAWVDKKGVRLQGWAIVDNVTGEAWKDVALSLVVGSPLSFRYNLHKPHHVSRPSLDYRAPQSAAAPPPPDVGYAKAEEMEAPEPMPEAKPSASRSGMGGYGMKMKKEAPRRRSARPMPPPPSFAPEGDMGPSPEMRRQAFEKSAAALVKGREVGALYAYDALTPVTVPDGQAALINIVNREVKGKDVFLFRDAWGNQPPFRAVLFSNTQASALESGPITLYVDGTFAGEGFLGRVDKDATTFVPYAQETGFKLHQSSASRTDEVRLARVVDGQITIEAKDLHVRTLAMESSRDQPSLAYVKLARRSGTELKDPPKDLIKSGNDIYVPIQVPAKGKAEVKIVEVSPIRRVERTLTSLVLTAFELYLKDASAVDNVAGPIRELLALNAQLADLDRQRSTLYRQRSLLQAEGHRIRNNLDSLPLAKVADKLRKKLVAQLEDNSRQAAEVAKNLVENEVQKAAIAEKMVVVLRQVSLK